MIKALTKVGNSKAVILPAQMIIKYKLGRKVMIEETEDGILIRSVQEETSFQKGLRKLRANKQKIYARMKRQAEDPKTKAYYANPENRFDDAQPEVFDDY